MPRIETLQERLSELKYVEEPFLKQLESLGWEIVRLEMHRQKPGESFREDFGEVVLLPKLREAILRINSWMDDEQIETAVADITDKVLSGNLIEQNKAILELIKHGTIADINQQTNLKSPTVKFVDFERLENNSFVAVSQFKVRILGSDRHIIPDIVLFVNGLPLAVVECKSPQIKEPIFDAVDQLMRYSEQRDETGAGNRKLFFYNQILVATYGREARFGTITTRGERLFRRWYDPYPLSIDELEHGASSPNEQQRLVAGMFARENLLSIVRTFTIFSTTDEGETIKIVGRYQQFRAVKKAVEGLLNGKTKEERGGIIWHTQGSGKSLTMLFMVREMFTRPELMKWKVVYITDRTQLQGQLAETSERVGVRIKTAESISELKDLLKSDSSELVLGMIHKFQERDLTATFPELNKGANILVMTDEAHRSLFKQLGANLDKALPNATLIGYTGTPTEKTEQLFKNYIDRYTMRDSIDDKVTLEIIYEGRTHDAEVARQDEADRKFQDVFKDYTPEQLLQIIGYKSRDAYLDAETTITAKAEDLVEHYLTHVFPNGFKAQVVANSREAAARYKTAIDKVLREKIEKLKRTNPDKLNLEVLERMKTAVIISGGGTNDYRHLRQYADPTQHKKDIENFKLPFDGDDERGGDIGFLIVNNMLLTGFDAPVEQVLYLDQIIKAHNLLQAIARVNRVANQNKEHGFVVDYVGIGNHLRVALADYLEKEQQEIVENLKTRDTVTSELVAAHRQMQEFLTRIGVSRFIENYDEEALFDLFLDEDAAFEFLEHFKNFSRALDAVYPYKEALDYVGDFKNYAAISCVVERSVGDWGNGRVSLKGVSEKLRVIADEHLDSLGISQTIAPISILDESFAQKVGDRRSERTQAAEIEHAVRHFIDVHLDEDAELYASFARRLEEILSEFKDNWAIVKQKLEELRREIIRARSEPTYGLHPRKQMPVFRELKGKFFAGSSFGDEQKDLLVNLTVSISELLEAELRLPNFWDSAPAQNRVKAELQKILLDENVWRRLPNVEKKYHPTISRVMEWAETNNETIVRGR